MSAPARPTDDAGLWKAYPWAKEDPLRAAVRKIRRAHGLPTSAAPPSPETRTLKEKDILRATKAAYEHALIRMIGDTSILYNELTKDDR